MRAAALLGLMLAGCVPGCLQQRALARAEAALSAGDLGSAEARYRAVLDDDPDQVDALYGLGWVYHLAGDGDRAREYFKRCVRLAPADYRGQRGLGAVALTEGNLSRAREHLDAALALAPEEPRTLNSLGLLSLAQGDDTAALGYFERSMAADPARGEVGLNLAEAQLRLGRPEQALNTLDAALSAPLIEQRFRGLLLEAKARVLVAMTSGREDPARCGETAPAVLAWLERADRALDQAQALPAPPPDLHATRRLVHRRRSVVTERCPGVGVPGPP